MELVIRATVIYWFLWLIVRGTGKRTLSDLSPIELLIVVVVGDMVQQGVTQEDMSVTGAVIVVCTFAMWMIVADFAARRLHVAERVLDGEAVIVLRDGEAAIDALRRERITVDELRAAAREAGHGDLRDIRFGVLEHDGRFSFVAARPSDTDTRST
jgi:uncharacterized membrane protein YcaP (DUF421 family)